MWVCLLALQESHWLLGALWEKVSSLVDGASQWLSGKESAFQYLLMPETRGSIPGLGRSSLVAQTVKRPPTMRETQVWPLGQEDPLEKEIATHSSSQAWKIPWTEEPRGAIVRGVSKSRTWLRLHFFLGRSLGGENGNLLHYSFLENPMDRGAWWATVPGVSKESAMTQRLNTQHSSGRGLHGLTFPDLRHRQLPSSAQLLLDTFSLSAAICAHAYSSFLLTPARSTDLCSQGKHSPIPYSLKDAFLAPCLPISSLGSIHFCLCYFFYQGQCLLGKQINVGGITTALNRKVWLLRNAGINPSSKLPQFPQNNQKR